ncbi:MAG: TIGR02996 domain-containing protein [Myxococcales bacterium]|nr:TIGR02996 domain-containing protein [Myxococcales bacterium]
MSMLSAYDDEGGFIHESLGSVAAPQVVSEIEALLASPDAAERARGAGLAHAVPCSAAAVRNECDYWITREQWHWYRDVVAGLYERCFEPLHALLADSAAAVACAATRFFPIFATQFFSLGCETSRAEAARVRQGLERVWDELRRIAASEAPVIVREHALVALDAAEVDEPFVLRVARALVEHEQAGARVIGLLGERNVADVAVHVLPKLDSPSATTRNAAAEYCGTLRVREAIPALIRLADDQAFADDADAYHQCGEWGYGHDSVASSALAALVRMGAREASAMAVARLAATLEDLGEGGYVPHEVLSAACQLATRDETDALIAIFELLSRRIDASGEAHQQSQPLGVIRRDVTSALARVGAEAVVPQLAAVCSADNGIYFREDYIVALLLLGGEAARPALRERIAAHPSDALALCGLASLGSAPAGGDLSSARERHRLLAFALAGADMQQQAEALLAREKNSRQQVQARLALLVGDFASNVEQHGAALCDHLVEHWFEPRDSFLDTFYLPLALALERLDVDAAPQVFARRLCDWLRATRDGFLAQSSARGALAAELLDRQLGRFSASLGEGAGGVDDALQAAIDADPDSPEPYLVYADHLLEREDPRGDLIVLCERARRAPQDRQLQVELARALAEHSERIEREHLGGVAPEEIELVWANGFIRTARIFGHSARITPRLLEAPDARFLRELVVFSEGVFNLPATATRPPTLDHVTFAQPQRSLEEALLKPHTTRWLILYDHDLKRLDPAIFSELAELELLTIYANKLREIPPDISRLTKLRQLGVSSCLSLATLPEQLFGIETLRHISTYDCKLPKSYATERLTRMLHALALVAAPASQRLAAFNLVYGNPQRARALATADDVRELKQSADPALRRAARQHLAGGAGDGRER